MLAFVVAASAVFGLAIGSFLNVVIARVPVGASVVRPPSRCPGCKVEIAWRDNIPVVGWLLLRGRCRACDQPISLRYPIIEVLTAAVFASAAARFGTDDLGALPAFCVWGAGLIALSAIDLDHHRLPNRVLYPTGFLAGGLLIAASGAAGEWRSLLDAALGGLVGFGFFFIVWLVAPAKMGYGDVRLSALNGILLGWLSVGHVGVAILLGSATASVVGILLIALHRAGRATPIPFGPFLAFGAWAAFLAGGPIIEWYLP